jgi:hypothetical protein
VTVHLIYLGVSKSKVSSGMDDLHQQLNRHRRSPQEISSCLQPPGSKHGRIDLQKHHHGSNRCEPGLQLSVLVVQLMDDYGKHTLATTNFGNPLTEQWNEHATDVCWGNHLNAVTICLNGSSISTSIPVKRHGNSGHGSLYRTRRCMRNIST